MLFPMIYENSVNEYNANSLEVKENIVEALYYIT